MPTESIRFSRVVEESGQPESYVLWTKPDQDKAFSALLRQNRVMTLHQETVGAKADYGSVGYTEDRHGSLLVFPKSLKSFEGKRVIGIKYDELKGASSEEAEPAEPQKKSAKPKPSRKNSEATKAALQKEPRPTKPAPAPKAKKEKPAPPPPPNQIAFPKPEIVKREKPAPAEDQAEELARLKKAVRGALEALSKDKPVTAFNLLKSTIESD